MKAEEQKTIYLKAEVVDSTGLRSLLKINGSQYAVDNKDLEQAQVLAVNQIASELLPAGRKLVLNSDLTGCIQNIGDKKVIHSFESLSELTELVRGQERNALNTIKDISSLIDDNNGITDKCLFEKLVSKLREQLLKKEKFTTPIYNEGDGGLP